MPTVSVAALGAVAVPVVPLSVVAALIITVWLAVVAEHDRRTRRIPNALLLPGVIAVVLGACIHPMVAVAAVAGSAAYLAAFVGGGCGGADVKLGFVLGGLIGQPIPALMMVALAQLGVLLGRCRAGPARRPHGPTMIVAAMAILGIG